MNLVDGMVFPGGVAHLYKKAKMNNKNLNENNIK